MTVAEVWAIIATTANFVYLVRWAYKRVFNYQISEAFVEDVATNHLPHIQACLHLIAVKLGIELPEPPPIKFIRLNGRHH